MHAENSAIAETLVARKPAPVESTPARLSEQEQTEGHRQPGARRAEG
jgi:hypothetical protein